MWNKPQLAEPPALEQVRKYARVLVIDDQDLPVLYTFKRDGYHFERWSYVENLSHLTDGHYHLILLDIEGVGFDESPELQGLGILREIKRENPAQLVVLYSSQPQSLSHNKYIAMADEVMDKSSSYVDYKANVDRLLKRAFTPGHFIAAMNQALGSDAVLAPKAVPKAIRALSRGDTRGFNDYIRGSLVDSDKAGVVIGVINTGLQAATLAVTV